VSLVNLVKLKMYATGKGTVDKAMMIAAAKERFGLEWDDNAGDAVWPAAQRPLKQLSSERSSGAKL
jgi:hypothetical protein